MAFKLIFFLILCGLCSCAVDKSSDQVKFALACVKGDLIEVAGLVRKNSINLNAVNGKIGPCLVSSIYGGYTELSEFLLENGADVNVRDEKGGTPLVFAVIGNKPEAVQFLLEHGADPNLIVPNEKGEMTDITAMKIARIRGNQQIIEILEKAVYERKGKQ